MVHTWWVCFFQRGIIYIELEYLRCVVARFYDRHFPWTLSLLKPLNIAITCAIKHFNTNALYCQKKVCDFVRVESDVLCRLPVLSALIVAHALYINLVKLSMTYILPHANYDNIPISLLYSFYTPRCHNIISQYFPLARRAPRARRVRHAKH